MTETDLFEAGDLVELRSGSMVMTVVGIDEDGKVIASYWDWPASRHVYTTMDPACFVPHRKKAVRP